MNLPSADLETAVKLEVSGSNCSTTSITPAYYQMMNLGNSQWRNFSANEMKTDVPLKFTDNLKSAVGTEKTQK